MVMKIYLRMFAVMNIYLRLVVVMGIDNWCDTDRYQVLVC